MTTLDDLIAQAVADEKAEESAKRAKLEGMHRKAQHALDEFFLRAFPRFAKHLLGKGIIQPFINKNLEYATSRHDFHININYGGAVWAIYTYEGDDGPVIFIESPISDANRSHDLYTTEETAERDLLLDIARYHGFKAVQA